MIKNVSIFQITLLVFVLNLTGSTIGNRVAQHDQHAVISTGNIYLANNSKIKGDIIFEKRGF